MFNELFVQVALVILVAGGLSLIAHRLRQPLIVAYILTGVIVGPGVLGVAQAHEVFAALSQIGIAFLLFVVGLELNWRNVKEVGRVAVIGALGQVIIASLLGFGVSQLLGFSLSTSIFVGVALSFSSTIIIVKLLQDKEDLERLYGRAAVGMLIAQDLIAMFLLLVVAALRDGGSLGEIVTISLVKGLAVLAFLFIFAHVVLPRLFRFAARSQELLFLATLAWCFGLASALHVLGFGIEIGALLAGISLAGSGFTHEIESKIRPLRDFFLVIFFIVLGTHITLSSIPNVWVPAVIFSLCVVVGNPLVTFGVMRLFKYHPRTAFMTGTSMAQVSEFAFILLASGIAIGLVEPDMLPMATLVGLITITLSSYLIGYNEQLYERTAFLFEWMTKEQRPKESRRTRGPDNILFGYHRMGEKVLPTLLQMPGESLVIDCNPHAVQELADNGVPAMYGDAGSLDLLNFLHVHKAKLLVSTIPDMNVNADILDFLGQRKFRGTVIVTARVAEDAARCYALGASYVIIPTMLGGEAFAQYLKLKKVSKTAWHTLARKQHHPSMS